MPRYFYIFYVYSLNTQFQVLHIINVQLLDVKDHLFMTKPKKEYLL